MEYTDWPYTLKPTLMSSLESIPQQSIIAEHAGQVLLGRGILM